MRARLIRNSIGKVAKASCDVYLEEEKENAQKSNKQGDIDSMLEIAVSYDMTTRRKEAKGTTHPRVAEH